MARYFFIVGEASGDRHAAELIKQIRLREPEALFAGLGGDQMETAGCVIYRHIRYMAFMGITAVLRHWRDVKDNFRIVREALLKEQPDVLVLVDYPSFNLQMASFCKRHLPKTRIVYYIPPKVWAWKKWRVHQTARLCDHVLGIFPFEPAFYAQYGYTCEYVGHPTVEQVGKVEKEKKKMKGERTRESIALLPGSRPSEISHCLPQMLEAARHFHEYNIFVCAAPGIEDDFYAPYLREDEQLTRDTYAAVQQATAAIVNSGTATLETALLGCPQVAVYHLAFSRLFGIAYRCLKPILFSIPYFTPVNIIVGKEVIKECVAYDFTVDKITAELRRLLTDEAYKKELLRSYEQLSSILGSQSASGTAADIITSKP